jgi:hypothetical protein
MNSDLNTGRKRHKSYAKDAEKKEEKNRKRGI